MLSELPEVKFKIALVGAKSVGKSTLAENFTKTGDEDESDLEQTQDKKENVYQIDLDYSKSRYMIDIEELNFKDIRADYLSTFDAVIYMFSCEDPESFTSMREFFIRQISGDQELKPRIVIANKVDSVKRYSESSMASGDSKMVFHANGDLNMIRAQNWIHKNMM